MTKAKTATERSQKLRKSRAAEGQAEVRGVFAPTGKHKELRKLFRKLVEEMGKK